MMVDRWPDGIPRDNAEMFSKYGALIANEIRRRNVVAGHFEDHYQTVCEKLVAGQVLVRFVQRVMASTDEDLPETMTAEDVCQLFGIKFPAWRSKQWSFHRVFKVDLAGLAPAGKTHGTIVRNGKDVSWVAWMPSPISGGYGSPKAVYKTSDVLEVPACGYFRNLKFNATAWPKRTVQPHHFVSYLLRAVNNHFFNACRTIMRRHKDRPGDFFAQNKTPDGDYNSNWADNIADPYAGVAAMEASADLTRELDRVCPITSEQKVEIGTLLKTHTIVEAVRASSLPPEQKRVLLSICEA